MDRQTNTIYIAVSLTVVFVVEGDTDVDFNSCVIPMTEG